MQEGCGNWNIKVSASAMSSCKFNFWLIRNTDTKKKPCAHHIRPCASHIRTQKSPIWGTLDLYQVAGNPVPTLAWKMAEWLPRPHLWRHMHHFYTLTLQQSLLFNCPKIFFFLHGLTKFTHLKFTHIFLATHFSRTRQQQNWARWIEKNKLYWTAVKTF